MKHTEGEKKRKTSHPGKAIWVLGNLLKCKNYCILIQGRPIAKEIITQTYLKCCRLPEEIRKEEKSGKRQSATKAEFQKHMTASAFSLSPLCTKQKHISKFGIQRHWNYSVTAITHWETWRSITWVISARKWAQNVLWCTLRSHKYRTQREREFLMCNKSMTFADTNCDHAFSLVHGMGQSEEVEVLLAPPWRRPPPGGKETWEHFLTCPVSGFWHMLDKSTQ